MGRCNWMVKRCLNRAKGEAAALLYLEIIWQMFGLIGARHQKVAYASVDVIADVGDAVNNLEP